MKRVSYNSTGFHLQWTSIGPLEGLCHLLMCMHVYSYINMYIFYVHMYKHVWLLLMHLWWLLRMQQLIMPWTSSEPVKLVSGSLWLNFWILLQRLLALIWVSPHVTASRIASWMKMYYSCIPTKVQCCHVCIKTTYCLQNTFDRIIYTCTQRDGLHTPDFALFSFTECRGGSYVHYLLLLQLVQDTVYSD